MVTGKIDLDNDRDKDIVIKGGLLVFLAIVIVVDMVFNSGQVTLGTIEAITNAASGG